MLTQSNIVSLADVSCFVSARRWRRDAEHLRDNADVSHLTIGQRAMLSSGSRGGRSAGRLVARSRGEALMAHVIETDYPSLMLNQTVALRAYAREHGRSWKTKLWVEWMNATANPLLHRLRNAHGPAWLDRMVLVSVAIISEEENRASQC